MPPSGCRQIAAHHEQHHRRRKPRHYIVWQLRGVEGEDDIGRGQPAHQESHFGIPFFAHPGPDHGQQGDPGEEAEQGGDQVVAGHGEAAVEGLGSALHDVLLHSHLPVEALSFHQRWNAPRGNDRQRDEQAGPELQPTPRQGFAPEGEAHQQQGEAWNQQSNGAFGEEAEAEGDVQDEGPEEGGSAECGVLSA